MYHGNALFEGSKNFADLMLLEKRERNKKSVNVLSICIGNWLLLEIPPFVRYRIPLNIAFFLHI